MKTSNQLIEQDHLFIKKICKPMLGFKSYESVKETLTGIELHHMIKKGQHKNAANMAVFEQFYTLAG